VQHLSFHCSLDVAREMVGEMRISGLSTAHAQTNGRTHARRGKSGVEKPYVYMHGTRRHHSCVHPWTPLMHGAQASNLCCRKPSEMKDLYINKARRQARVCRFNGRCAQLLVISRDML
jgi:hypothetical protein